MSHPVPPFIADHILEIISNRFQLNFTKKIACGAHFQFHNYDLFEKVNCNQIT